MRPDWRHSISTSSGASYSAVQVTAPSRLAHTVPSEPDLSSQVASLDLAQLGPGAWPSSGSVCVDVQESVLERIEEMAVVGVVI